ALEKHLIRRGDQVILLLGSANRDPRWFDHPDEIDLFRGTCRNFAFGRGNHTCLGIRISRTIQEMVFQHLIGRYGEIRVSHRPKWTATLPMRGLKELRVEMVAR